MKATVNAKELKDAISWASKVVGRSVLPILDCALLTAEEGTLIVRTTNLEVELVRRVTATVTEAGRITTNAKTLKNYLGKVKKGTLAMETHTNSDKKLPWLTLDADGLRSTFATSDPEDYPLDKTQEGWDHTVVLDPAAVHLRQIVPFTHKDSFFRACLHAVFVEVYDRKYLSPGGVTNRFRLTAADRFKLVSTNPVNSEVVASYFLPRKAAEMMAPLGKGLLRLKTGDNNSTWAEYATEDSIVRSLYTGGKFPDFTQIVPASDKGTWASFETAVLADKLRGLAAISDPDNHLVGLDLIDGKATLSARYEDNEATTELPSDWNGGEFAIVFNAKYMLDCLALCGERARIMFQEPFPEVLKEDGTVSRRGQAKAMLIEGDDCQMVLMPMDMR